MCYSHATFSRIPGSARLFHERERRKGQRLAEYGASTHEWNDILDIAFYRHVHAWKHHQNWNAAFTSVRVMKSNQTERTGERLDRPLADRPD
jgi:hypothetical protein